MTHPSPDEVDALRAVMKRNTIPTLYREAHPTCCKGFRVEAKHSPYCFTLKGYYTMAVHPDALPKWMFRMAKRHPKTLLPNRHKE